MGSHSSLFVHLCNFQRDIKDDLQWSAGYGVMGGLLFVHLMLALTTTFAG